MLKHQLLRFFGFNCQHMEISLFSKKRLYLVLKMKRVPGEI